MWNKHEETNTYSIEMSLAEYAGIVTKNFDGLTIVNLPNNTQISWTEFTPNFRNDEIIFWQYTNYIIFND